MPATGNDFFAESRRSIRKYVHPEDQQKALGQHYKDVMLNNLKDAMPQLGVSKADIIYEIPAEGGVTRMIGVFQSLEGVETLGSIRSTRPYYLEVALGHDAILVHAGASPDDSLERNITVHYEFHLLTHHINLRVGHWSIHAAIVAF